MRLALEMPVSSPGGSCACSCELADCMCCCPACVAILPAPDPSRPRMLRRAWGLALFTIGWNAIEALVGLAAGIAAGSVALVGFGLDSVVEASSGTVALWRIGSERRRRRSSEEAERVALLGVAVAFLALAAYVGGRAIADFVQQSRPHGSPAGVALAVVSLIVMPLLARRKRAAARKLGSRSLEADSTQTDLCAWLSAALLAGLLLNAIAGWWWADPVAAFAISALAAREGVTLWKTRDVCC